MRPFAIIVMTALKVRFFDSKDLTRDAVKDYTRSGIPILVFKWDEQAKIYAPMEVKTF